VGRRWTEQDINNLRQLARRFPALVIAETMDRTVGAVAFKAQQLNLHLPTRLKRSKIDQGARLQTFSSKSRNDQSA
jgi:hypothetical protein